MSKLKFGDSEFDIPAIAQGKVVPHVAQIPFEESAAGKQIAELQKLRQDFDEYVANQETQRIAQEECRRVERKRNLLVSLVAGSLTGLVSGIFMYYWHAIAAWASSLAQ